MVLHNYPIIHFCFFFNAKITHHKYNSLIKFNILEIKSSGQADELILSCDKDFATNEKIPTVSKRQSNRGSALQKSSSKGRPT